MICYAKTNGIAHDLRFVDDDYSPLKDETLITGDVLPDIDSLSDADALAVLQSARDLEDKKSAALQALNDERLAQALSDPNSPAEVKDYAQCVGAPSVTALPPQLESAV